MRFPPLSKIWLAGAAAALLALTLAPARTALADGFIYVPDGPHDIVIRPHPHPHRRRRIPPRREFPLEVTKHRVQVEIQDTVAHTKVEETFYNPNARQLEGIYMFPLPPGAAITDFQMKMGGVLVAGEVLERDKARSIYEDIVRRVKDPGLLEYVDRGLFKARVFPIPARGGVDVTIEYSESLVRDSGLAKYRYPLDTGKYSIGPYKDVVIDLKLHSNAPIRSIHCPTHEVSVSRNGEKEARIGFEAKTLEAHTDFIVQWHVSEGCARSRAHDAPRQREGGILLSVDGSSARPARPSSPEGRDLRDRHVREHDAQENRASEAGSPLLDRQSQRSRPIQHRRLFDRSSPVSTVGRGGDEGESQARVDVRRRAQGPRRDEHRRGASVRSRSELRGEVDSRWSSCSRTASRRSASRTRPRS